jgi:peptide/nickel transport system substrate-binding protein
VIETRVVTQVVKSTPVEVIQVVTPTPEPGGPRALIVCQDQEPDTLYPYTAGSARENILEAIAEGGWSAFDINSFAYRPIILEKLPDLIDGDAALAVLTVSDGDFVVDAYGNVVTLDAAADPPILLVPSGGGDPVPYQGGDFEMDQLTATFKLLPDLMWSDGTLITAADSLYAFNLLADPETQVDKFKIVRTASYDAIDDLTIVWTGLPGFMDPYYYTNFFGPAPEHAWGMYTPDELLTAEESSITPIGYGPYVISEWVSGDHITLHKNPNYFRAGEDLPNFDTVVFRFVGLNANENITSILSGECDIIDRTTGLDDQSELLIELQSSVLINTHFAKGIAWEHIDFGIQPRSYDDGYQIGIDRPDFFSDVRTRRAFAMCMDREVLVETITFGQSLVMDSYLPPQHPLYNPDVRHYDYDIEAGSALLEEVGWVDDDGDPETARVAMGVANVQDGTPLEVNYETTSSGLRPTVANLLQESLAQCGIQTNFQDYHPAEFFADGPEGKLFGRRFDLGAYAWLVGIEPPCDLYVASQNPGPIGETWVSVQEGKERTFGPNGWSAQNYPGFANEEYELACSTAKGLIPGQPEYEAAHLEAQKIFSEQLPVVPLYLTIKLAATRPDMCGFIMDPSANSEFWNIEEFDYGEGCDE